MPRLRPPMFTPRLAKPRPQLPKTIPTLDQVADLLWSEKYAELRMAIYRLKEYRLGLQIVTRLIDFVERHPLLDGRCQKHQKLLVHLWRSKLAFLDAADEWDTYLTTVDALKRRPELRDSFGPTAMDEATYTRYQRMVGKPGLERGLRFLIEDLMAQAQHPEAAITGPSGERLIRIPRQTRHMLESFDLRDRLMAVKRKVALRDSGRRVDYLRHKQNWDLTDEEYADRIEWLRVWREYCERCRRAQRAACSVA